MNRALGNDANAVKGKKMKITNGENKDHSLAISPHKLYNGHQSVNEKFVGLVGPVGAGTSVVAGILQHKFVQQGYDVELIKVSQLIRSISVPASLGIKRLDPELAGCMHNAHYWGNEIRRGVYKNNVEDHAAIARLVLQFIMKCRSQRVEHTEFGGFVNSIRKPMVYLIDSLRNPAESEVLRKVYHNSFYLLGVVCDATIREERVRRKLFQSSERVGPEIVVKLREILENDQSTDDKYGQQVANTLLDADYFVDNGEDWGSHFTNAQIYTDLGRFVDWVAGTNSLIATVAEEAMYEAHKASLQNATLLNQIGASLVDEDGQFVGTGSSDIPPGGDAVFKNAFSTSKNVNGRCIFCNNPNFFDMIEHDQMIDEIVEKVSNMASEVDAGELTYIIREVLLKHKLEFSRIIHAEIDAIITAIRSGISTIGCKMFVTSFPCQACIGYIASAGVNEVIYIEPYPAAEIFKQFDDSITPSASGWIPPSSMRLIYSSDVANQVKHSRVLFRPYVGIAPRRFAEVFQNTVKEGHATSSSCVTSEPELNDDLTVVAQTHLTREREFSQQELIGN